MCRYTLQEFYKSCMCDVRLPAKHLIICHFSEGLISNLLMQYIEYMHSTYSIYSTYGTYSLHVVNVVYTCTHLIGNVQWVRQEVVHQYCWSKVEGVVEAGCLGSPLVEH